MPIASEATKYGNYPLLNFYAWSLRHIGGILPYIIAVLHGCYGVPFIEFIF